MVTNAICILSYYFCCIFLVCVWLNWTRRERDFSLSVVVVFFSLSLSRRTPVYLMGSFFLSISMRFFFRIFGRFKQRMLIFLKRFSFYHWLARSSSMINNPTWPNSIVTEKHEKSINICSNEKESQGKWEYHIDKKKGRRKKGTINRLWSLKRTYSC